MLLEAHMKKITKLSLLLLVVVLSFSMIGCDWLLEEVASSLAAPQGYVYNVKTGDPLSGVEVQLRDTSGTVKYTDTTSSSGYYTFSDVEYGTFELTAVDGASEYVF